MATRNFLEVGSPNGEPLLSLISNLISAEKFQVPFGGLPREGFFDPAMNLMTTRNFLGSRRMLFKSHKLNPKLSTKSDAIIRWWPRPDNWPCKRTLMWLKQGNRPSLTETSFPPAREWPIGFQHGCSQSLILSFYFRELKV